MKNNKIYTILFLCLLSFILTGCNHFITWSPDGKKIAFVGFPSEDPGHGLFLMNSDGTNIERLTEILFETATMPRFSPDGKKLAYISLQVDKDKYLLGEEILPESGFKMSIRIIDLLTKQKQDLVRFSNTFTENMIKILSETSRGGGFYPIVFYYLYYDWSKDGKWIIYHELIEGNDASIWLVDVKSGKKKEMVNSKEMPAFPVWAPNSQEFAYRSPCPQKAIMGLQTGEPAEIWVMDLKGRKNKISDFAKTGIYAIHSPVTWSPDSKRIAYIATAPGKGICNLYAVSPSNKKVDVLFDNIECWENPQWSPDGRMVVAEIFGENEQSIWVYDIKAKQSKKYEGGSFPSWGPNGKYLALWEWKKGAYIKLNPQEINLKEVLCKSFELTREEKEKALEKALDYKKR